MYACASTLYNISFICIFIFTCSISLPLPLGFVFSPFWRQNLEPSIDVVSESDLGSFFYETVYDAASTIDYSKEPIDAGVVDSPPPKKIFRPSPSPSPLKGAKSTSVPASPNHSGGHVPPQRRLRMDDVITKCGPLHVPLRDALPVRSNSNSSGPLAKVNLSQSIPINLNGLVLYICLGPSTQTNLCGCCVLQWLPGCAHPQTSAAQCGSSAGTLLCLAQ